MTTVLLAGLVACTVAVAVAAYLIVRVLRWADHALPEWLDPEPQPNDISETGGTR